MARNGYIGIHGGRGEAMNALQACYREGSGISPRWELYDRLLSLIPDALTVKGILIGQHWILVRSEGVGISMAPVLGRLRYRPDIDSFIGCGLRDLATLVTSWHPFEAALGVAAMNSYFNAPSTIAGYWRVTPGSQKNESIFHSMKEALAGKRVAVVGHFPDLDELAQVCLLSILERSPQDGDYPDPACEYILHDQEYLFMTGVTFTNKTLPRLMELGRAATMVLVGQSVPLVPHWIDSGITMLAGTVVMDDDRLWRHVAQGGDRSIFRNGAVTIKLRAEDVRPVVTFEKEAHGTAGA